MPRYHRVVRRSLQWPAIAALALAGCTDVFVLPLGAPDQAVGDAVDLSASDDGDQMLDGGGGSEGGGDGPAALPASCARLPCVPARNEGDVALTDGTVSGCHAYNTLSIGALSTVKVGRDASGVGFAACADLIFIGGILNADGAGEPPAMGMGAGGTCGSGGSHGGQGADPAGCGGGGTYGDANQPRTFGSGGGGLSSSGGAGGGVIELEARSMNVLGFVTADGSNGNGASAGGGAGGSVLLRADSIDGAGQVTARGGIGIGIAGGGGGGGRIALYVGSGSANLKTDANGGSTMNGSASGTAGTVVKMP